LFRLKQGYAICFFRASAYFPNFRYYLLAIDVLEDLKILGKGKAPSKKQKT